MAVRFKGNRQQLVSLAYELKDAIVGRSSKVSADVVEGFFVAIGFGALTDIHDAFKVKASGGTDDMGIKWPPLKPETIANRRFGPGEKAALNRQAKMKVASEKHKQDKHYAELLKRLSKSLPLAEAKTQAKAIAYKPIKPQTKVQKYGHRHVEMLRDTGVLFNSLSPGRMASGGNRRPQPEQVFELNAGSVIVGSTVQYAAAHQYGVRERNLPPRPFLPVDENQIPDQWWQRWLDISVVALKAGVEVLYRRAA